MPLDFGGLTPFSHAKSGKCAQCDPVKPKGERLVHDLPSPFKGRFDVNSPGAAKQVTSKRMFLESP